MPKIFHFFSTLLHTIDKTMEEENRHRWSDHVSEAKHLRNKPAASDSGIQVNNRDNNGPSDLSQPQ